MLLGITAIPSPVANGINAALMVTERAKILLFDQSLGLHEQAVVILQQVTSFALADPKLSRSTDLARFFATQDRFCDRALLESCPTRKFLSANVAEMGYGAHEAFAIAQALPRCGCGARH